MEKLKQNTRVKRASGQGPSGILKEIRSESGSTRTEKDKDKSLMANVLWDNGTQSYVSPEALLPSKD